MVMTGRDLEILKWCLEQRFMILDQIAQMFFPESRNRYKVPARRVDFLVREGWLKREKPRVTERTLYLVTRKGVRLLRQKGLSSGLGALDQVDLKTFEHDRLLTDVRIAFAHDMEIVDWTAERVLKKRHPWKKVPDAIVRAYDKAVTIEVELSLKNRKYYERVFLNYRRDWRDIRTILYLVRDGKRQETILRRAKDWEEVYVAPIDEFLKEKQWTQFENRDGSIGFWELLTGYDLTRFGKIRKEAWELFRACLEEGQMENAELEEDFRDEEELLMGMQSKERILEI